MGCSAGNYFAISPSPATTSAAKSSRLIAFPFPFHYKRTGLHVEALNHERLKPLRYSFRPLQLNHLDRGGDGGGGGGGGGGNGGGGGDDESGSFFNFDRNSLLLPSHLVLSSNEESRSVPYALLVSVAASLSYFVLSSSPARAKTGEIDDSVYEIKGGKRIELLPDYAKDEFVVPEKVWFWPRSSKHGNSTSSQMTLGDVWTKCRDLTAGLLLPEGFPESVTSDYLEYSLWRGVQGVAAQISGVLATQVIRFPLLKSSTFVFVAKCNEELFEDVRSWR